MSAATSHRPAGKGRPGSEEARVGSRRFALICAVTLVLAACSILYQLVIAQTLSLLAANTVVWYSVTIGLYLLSMGVGSLACDAVTRRFTPSRVLFWVEVALAIVGASAVFVIHLAHMLFTFSYVWDYAFLGTVAFFGSAFVATVVVGFLTGLELPLLIRLGNETAPENKSRSSAVLGVDYFGSLLGAVSFPTLLLPNLELFVIGIATAGVNIAVALIFVERSPQHARSGALGWGSALAVAALLLVGAIQHARIEQYFLKKYYYYLGWSTDSIANLFAPLPDTPSVLRRSSPYQKVDLMEEIQPDTDISNVLVRAYSSKPRHPDRDEHILFLNGDFQVATALEEVYHEYFAHVPIISRGAVPRNILVLGGGDGMLIKELLKYPQVEKITHVDLDPELIELAKTNEVLLRENDGALLHPKVETILGDGYHFSRNTQRRFDAVYIDFPMPADYNLAKLYSREFFQFVGRLIGKNGYIVFDAVGIGMLSLPDENGQRLMAPGNDWPIYYHTLKKAGFNQVIPYVTMLENDNPRILDVVAESGMDVTLSGSFGNLRTFVQADEEWEVLLRLALRELAEQYINLQQGFIMLSHTDGVLSRSFRPLDIPLHVLNRERFQLAFAGSFPVPEEIDESKVNSILRPAFPTIPIWTPRRAL